MLLPANVDVAQNINPTSQAHQHYCLLRPSFLLHQKKNTAPIKLETWALQLFCIMLEEGASLLISLSLNWNWFWLDRSPRLSHSRRSHLQRIWAPLFIHDLSPNQMLDPSTCLLATTSPRVEKIVPIFCNFGDRSADENLSQNFENSLGQPPF